MCTNMSAPARYPQFSGSALESRGDPLQLRPLFPKENRRFDNFSNTECRSFKKPRISGIAPNLEMPEVLNRVFTGKCFKTRLCTKFRFGNCSFGAKCIYAHGIGDIRKARMTEESGLCRMFSNGKKCIYGNRCHFLHEIPQNLGQHLIRSRESSAIGIRTVSSTADNSSGSGQFEHKRVVTAGLNANGVNTMPVIFKSRPCLRWEMNGDCPFGNTCNFAHGQAELQELGIQTMLETGTMHITASNTLPSTKHASTHTTEMVTNKQKVEGGKCIFKWRSVEHNSGIYADWTEDNALSA